MKRFLLLCSICFCIITAGAKTVTCSAGALYELIPGSERDTLSSITITGTIDERDFYFMRDSLVNVKIIDLSNANIVAYLKNGIPSSNGNNNTIPEKAFCNYKISSKLENFIFPKNTIGINDNAFFNCLRLKSITLPASVKFLSPETVFGFVNCPVEVDANNPFFTSKDSVVFNKSMTKLCFACCNKTGKYIIPDGVKKIEQNAFRYSKLTNVVLPESVDSLGRYVFYESDIRTVNIPSKISEIPDGMFYSTVLESISLPSTITKIGSYAFYDCSHVTNLTLPQSLQYIDNYAFYNSKFKTIDLPKTLVSIGDYAFCRCTTEMCSLKIPFSTKTIGAHAFEDSQVISSVTFENTLESIGSYAFANCYPLFNIYANSMTPIDFKKTNSTFVFKNSLINYPLMIPVGSKKAYMTADQWKDLGSFEEWDPFYIMPYSMSLNDTAGYTSIMNLQCTAREWSAIGSQSWYKVEKLPSIDEGYARLQLIVTETNKGAERTDTLRFSGSMAQSKYVIIDQQALQPRVSATSTDVSLTKAAGDTAQITMKANTTFNLSTNSSWLHISQLSVPEGLTTITLIADSNKTISPRTAIVYLQNERHLYLQITVTQLGTAPVLTLSRDVITADVLEKYYKVSVTTNTNWTAIASDKWLYADHSDDKTLYCRVYENKETKQRTGTIVVSAKDLPDQKITITQNAAPLQFSLYSLPHYTFYSAGGTDSLLVRTNATITSISSEGWLTTSVSQERNGDYYVHLTATQNTDQLRLATLTIQISTGETRTVTVVQLNANDSISKSIDISAGVLNSVLTSVEKWSITDITLSGTIDARDFKILRDSMPMLKSVDISNCIIVGYSGADGTNTEIVSCSYPANELPVTAFSSKEKLCSLLLPKSCTSLGGGSIAGCPIKNIELPSSLVQIADYALSGVNCESIIVPQSVKSIGVGAFSYGLYLKKVYLPDSLKAVSNRLFMNSKGLETVSMPNGVLSIGEMAFQNCTNLQSITLPFTLQTIGNAAFANCDSLRSVTALMKTPIVLRTSNAVFEGVDYGNCILTVPSINASWYSNAVVWANFIQRKVIQLTPDKANIVLPDGKSRTTTINVTASGSWKASSSASWISVKPETEITGNGVITLTTDGSSTVDPRSAIITLKGMGFENYVTVSQTHFEPVLKLSAQYGRIYGFVEFSFTRLSIIANIPWQATSDADWLKIENEWGRDYNASLLISATSDTKERRIATVVIKSDYFADQVFTVTQTSLYDVLTDTVVCSAGDLANQLGSYKLHMLTHLKVKGQIDARDFRVLRDSMVLQSIDLSEATVAPYSGSEGTVPQDTTYEANHIPVNAFTTCRNLFTFKFPVATTAIDKYSFYDCNNLSSIELPNTISDIGESAFEGCSRISSPIVLSNKITKLKSRSFCGCSIGAVTGGDSITTIEDHVFADCKYLQQVSIPNNVVEIGIAAFKNCHSLTTKKLPSSLKRIGDSAFSYMKIDSITIPSSAILLGNAILSNCDALEYVNIQSAVNTLPWSTFNQSKNLKTIILPETLTEISNNLLCGNRYLSTIHIPESVAKIGASAFEGDEALKKICLPRNLLQICDYAFRSSGLQNVELPKSLTTIGKGVFANNLKSIKTNNQIPLSLVDSALSWIDRSYCVIYVPYGAASLYKKAKQWQSFYRIIEYADLIATEQINTSQIAEGVSELLVYGRGQWTVESNQLWLTISSNTGKDTASIQLTAQANTADSSRTAIITFYDSNNNKHNFSYVQLAAQSSESKIITLDAGDLINQLNTEERKICKKLTLNGTIDARDFKFMRDSMPSLQSIDLCMATISAYSGDAGTDELTKTYAANTVPKSALSKMKALQTVQLPNALCKIDNCAFLQSSNLLQVTFPDTVSVIENAAFCGCQSLREINLPKKITEIDSNVFYGCSNLTQITFPDNVKVIREYAFVNSGLTSIDIPATVIDVANGVFIQCNNLKKAKVASQNISYQVFMLCKNLTSLTFSSNLTSIGDRFVLSCDSLETIEIPASVTKVGEYIFEGSSLKNIILNAQISRIDKKMFDGNDSLKTITLPATLDSIGEYTFVSKKNLETIVFQSSLKCISQNAFNNSTIKSISIPESVTNIDALVFYNCPNLSDVTLPKKLKTISQNLFASCSNLSKIILPDSLEIIQSYALSSTSISTIRIPLSVNQLGYGILSGTPLKSIYVENPNPSNIKLEYNVFYGIDANNCILYVPKGSLALYKNAEQWKTFIHIVEWEKINISNKELVFDAISSSQNVTIESDVTWIANVSSNWLQVVPNGTTLAVQVSENSKAAVRKAYIKLVADGIALDSILVSQSAAKAEISIEKQIKTTIDSAAYADTITIASNGVWKASSEASWLHIVNTDSVSGNGQLIYTVDANPMAFSRSTTLSIAMANGKDSVITITQLPAALVLSPEKQTLSFESNQSDTVSVILTTNAKWTATSDASWLSISPQSGVGNDTLIIITQTNTGSERSATITIAVDSAHLKGFVYKTITVTQKASTQTSLTNVADDSLLLFPNPAGAGADLIIKNDAQPILQVEIVSIEGKKLYSAKHNSNEARIPLHNIASGIYVVKVCTNSCVVNRRLIVE